VSGVLGHAGEQMATLLVVAGLVMDLVRPGRSLYFAEGVVAAYLGLLRFLFQGPASSASFLVAALLGIGALALIVAAHRRMVER
jgi:hypothetical protein